MKSDNGIVHDIRKASFLSKGREEKDARNKVTRSLYCFGFGFFFSMNLFIVVVLVVVLVRAGSVPSRHKL
jgi:hypothetical protein